MTEENNKFIRNSFPVHEATEGREDPLALEDSSESSDRLPLPTREWFGRPVSSTSISDSNYPC